MHWSGVYRPERITDGRADWDGADSLSSRAAPLGLVGAEVVYDLGGAHRIGAAFAQVAGGPFVLAVSEDGTHWRELWRVADRAQRRTLRTEQVRLENVPARYVRFALAGRLPAGIAELELHAASAVPRGAAFTRSRLPPETAEKAHAPWIQAWHKTVIGSMAFVAVALLSLRWRPLVARVSMAATAAALVTTLAFTRWNSLTGSVAGVALAYFAWCLRMRTASVRTTLLLALAVIGVLSWTNFGAFRGRPEIHVHDAFHYFLGSKYVRELRHDGLYACALRAARENAHWPALPDREVRDLVDNEIVPETRLSCGERFDDSRWRAFRRDVSFFEGRATPSEWSAHFVDHGYNGTPVMSWLLGTWIGAAPASEDLLTTLAFVDPVLYAVAFAAIAWAFGFEVLALALLVWGLGFPWRSDWTVGGIGRAVWVASSAVGLALLRKGRPGAGGACLGAAIALQILPVVFLLGPALALVREWLAGRAGDAVTRRLLATAALTAVTLGLLAATMQGVEEASSFVQNTLKHQATEFENSIGMQSLIRLVDEGTTTLQVTPRAIIVQVARVLLLLLLGLALRADSATWHRAALGPLFFVPLADLTSYYYVAFTLLVPALVDARWTRLGLLGVALATNLPVLAAGGVSGRGVYAFESLLFAAFVTGVAAWALARRVPIGQA